ncbi:MAG: TIGR00730 family Rossman fold protein [Brevinematales bacterium]
MYYVTVFCGSQLGKDPMYVKIAEELGERFVRDDVGLVYGGTSVGLMGRLAETVVKKNGKVIGILPEFLQHIEIAYPSLSELRITQDIDERKRQMLALSKAVIALPGGVGTLEELSQAISWKKLDLYRGEIAVLNFRGFFDGFLKQLDIMLEEGFIDAFLRRSILVEGDVDLLWEQLKGRLHG